MNPVSIHVTYNDTKRIISYQKGGDVQGLTSKILQRFSDVLPANVFLEQVKLHRYDKRFKDLTECKNKFKFDDDHKVTVLIKEVQTQGRLRPVSIHVTYNDTKRIISYQKGGDVQELTNQFLQRFSDVLPANVTSEQVKLLRYDERFKDHAELENEFKFDDDHKVTVLIKEVQAEEKEGRTPRCSSDNTSSMLRSEPWKKEPFTYFEITDATIYRLWNRFSRKEDGIVRRDPNSGDVHYDGSSEKGDDKNTHVKTKFKKPRGGDYCFCFALLFNDADTNKQYAMKSNGKDNIITEEENDDDNDKESDDASDVFLCSNFGCFTIFQHYNSKLYLGCDHDGKATLVNSPSPQTLFIASKVV